jgi:class 3 adenylate cyclase/pimeloyl-ACP methyl ester carboxylesterase
VGGTPLTRYASAGGLSIAYQDVGDGVPVVWVPGFVSHVELQRDLPCLSGFIDRLEHFARLITFDKRGTGLSDRSLGLGTLEDRMDDIRAVYDACGLERAALIGTSEGGPLSVLFAATFPERVSHLVLYGAYTHTSDRQEVERIADDLVEGWGTGMLAGLVVQHCDEAARAQLARFERYSCTPKMVAEKFRADGGLDVRGVLGTVKAPTLVLHNRADPLVPVVGARAMAAGIVGARLIELPGDFHSSWRPHDYDVIVGHIEQFVTGRHTADRADRVLSTVVFSDIVGSTQQASKLGDRDWHELLDRHDQAMRTAIGQYRGREVNTTGDGFFAAFDGPGRAIRCAVEMTQVARTLGLELRVGVHTGECEVRGENLAGIAVHIGARVADHAEPGQVLVTGTVRDLVAGSGIEFADLGLHTLKDVGEWHLLAVNTHAA